MKKVLTIVDVQNDFLEDGALPVKGASSIIPIINNIIKNSNYDLIITTQDWHPEGHISYAKTHNKEPYDEITIDSKIYTLWPEHCISFTYGAEISKLLELPKDTITTYKATNKDEECNSGFSDVHKRIIDEIERDEDANAIFDFVGIALDYCVYSTVREANEYIQMHNLLSRVNINVFIDACASIEPKNVPKLYRGLPTVNLVRTKKEI